MIVPGQGVVVPVEHRQHGGYSTKLSRFFKRSVLVTSPSASKQRSLPSTGARKSACSGAESDAAAGTAERHGRARDTGTAANGIRSFSLSGSGKNFGGVNQLTLTVFGLV